MTPLVIFPFFNATLFIYFTISFQKRDGIFLDTFACASFFFFPWPFTSSIENLIRIWKSGRVTAGSNMCWSKPRDSSSVESETVVVWFRHWPGSHEIWVFFLNPPDPPEWYQLSVCSMGMKIFTFSHSFVYLNDRWLETPTVFYSAGTVYSMVQLFQLTLLDITRR